METFYQTDVGRVRSHNEDSVTILKNDNDEYLLIVADGMGGHRAGEVASSIAITHLGSRFKGMSSVGSKIDAAIWLNDNVNEINKEILDYAKTHDDAKGLGTTIVTALLTKKYLIFGNIGDSSGFILKSGKLHKMTHDDTLVNLLIESGNLTKEEAKNHPKKNVLTKSLGTNESTELDLREPEVDVNTLDGILLCSDGLTNMLTQSQIEKVLNEELSIEEKVKKLIRKCNMRGGIDNISIAYLDMRSGW